MKTQTEVTKYYDRFSTIYDWISSKRYYQKPRIAAIKALQLQSNQNVLNLPCGTGQNFEYFQKYLKETGQIIGIDLSEGMLQKAHQNVKQNDWQNVKIIKDDANHINSKWIKEQLGNVPIHTILCDLGLSGFPNWQTIIDNLLDLLEPNGKIVIMDWYIEKTSLRGELIKWLGKGEVNRPIWQYLQPKVAGFKLETFKNV